MLLNVYLQARSLAPQRREEYEHVASIDEACYWFLRPVLDQLQQRTGQAVEPYDTVSFGGADLDALSLTIAEARQRAKSRPESWNVRIGVQFLHRKRDVYAVVRKAALAELLLDIEEAVEKARAREWYVAFWGG